MSLRTLVNRAVDTPVDYAFIKRVVGKTASIRMVDHESGLPDKPTLEQVFKGKTCVAILLHIVGSQNPVGHWVLLIQKRPGSPISFFDSLGIGLTKLYKFYTHETPKLLYALRGHKWENSHVALQKQGKHFRECGAFISVRAKFWKLSNKAFVKLIKSWNRTKPDDTAVLLVLLHYLEDEGLDVSSKNYKRLK